MEEGIRILVAEDDPSVYRLISFKLEMEGYLVDIATDGQEALKKALEKEYDAMILDLMLPLLDGFQVLKGVRDQKDLPILILSAKSLEKDIMRGFTIGANEYLVKPFAPNELLTRLKRMLGR